MNEGNRSENETCLVNYCLECEWSASTEDHTRIEQAGLVVEHAVTTNHDIDSEYRSRYRKVGEPTRGWADEWPPSEQGE